MGSFTTSKPAKYSDANGKYTRIDTSKIPSRGKSLSSSPSTAAGAGMANGGRFSAAVAASGGFSSTGKLIGSRNIAGILDETSGSIGGGGGGGGVGGSDEGDTGSTGSTSSTASLFTSHVQGVISLLGVVILLMVVQFGKISSDNSTYVRGVLNMLTGLAASASAHKLSMTVAVSSLKSASTTSPAMACAAMGLKPADAFNLVFGSDSFFQIISFVEAICSAVASYMAGSSIVTSTDSFTKAGVALLELDMSQAATLWGICGLWIFALLLHAATAFAAKSTIKTVSAASQESIREIMAVMQTESLYSAKH
ncbi:hypothetical protein BCV70DRAFT_199757 [Testicularia cyperi]|uniref:Uncharacterized protein n=1 Tax=Testicularia cyperi TaxID=1882483 RepID=A0A317XT04_9BASI|nr:hypothetical protein BCV70DRAFT_199757 [Testicularia cyperi]